MYKSREEITEKAVDVCLSAWRALKNDKDIDPCQEYTNFMDDLVFAVNQKCISDSDSRIPLLLCVIASLKTNEELTDLNALLETIRKSLKVIEKCDLSDDEKASLRSIIADTIDRNFPTRVINSPIHVSYDKVKLRPWVLRYIEGYEKIYYGV